MRCAVLFASRARGDDETDSDLDLLVWLGDATRAERNAMARRLSARWGGCVDVLDVRDAGAQPTLLESIIRDGRVVADRENLWPALREEAGTVRRRADHERRELAAEAAAAREFFAAADTERR